MILVEKFTQKLIDNNINFFSGVPDSILKNFSNYLEKIKKRHLIAVNEGAAIAMGIGYFLSTKKLPCVYLQNSGLSNAINPLISIAHKKIYSIPLLMVIGWRGSPNIKDEPQHAVKGKITRNLLQLLGIRFHILRNHKDLKKIDKLIKYAKSKNEIVACLIEKNTLSSNLRKIKHDRYESETLNRKNFIEIFLKLIPANSRIISTTGYTSRELFNLRKEKKLNKGKDFYMVGAMGHSQMVSLGYSIYSKKKVFCLDGDGSILMHMGAMRNLAFYGKKNITHIFFNNNAHESVGGQPTTADGINFKLLSKSLGYKNFLQIKGKKNIENEIKKIFKLKGPSLVEVKIKTGTIKNLGRPSNFSLIKKNFF